jgi:hypothetical protein
MDQSVERPAFHRQAVAALQSCSIYLIAAMPPLTVSAWFVGAVPPLWKGVDSASILLWPIHNIPHYPPLYMTLIHSAEIALGMTPWMLKTVIVLQHLLLIGSIVYMASAFRLKLPALVLATFAVLGAWLGSFAHVVATQAVEIPLLALLVGIMLRIAQRPSGFLLAGFVVVGICLASARHASIVFTLILPLYWMLVALAALFTGGALRRHVWASVTGVAAVLTILVASVAVTDLACVAYQSVRGTADCTRVYGRAGIYRILATIQRVPTAEQENWLAARTEGLPEETASAFRIMARDNAPWLGAYIAIKEKHPDHNTDGLMNAAFFRFLLSPDRFSLAQTGDELAKGFRLGRRTPLWSYLRASVSALQNPAHDKLRERLGVDSQADAQRLRKLTESTLVAAYDAYTRYWLTPVALLAFLIAVLVTRAAGIFAFGLAMIASAIGCVLLVAGVTVVVSAYLLPVDFLMFVLTGFSICAVLQPRLLPVAEPPAPADALGAGPAK